MDVSAPMVLRRQPRFDIGGIPIDEEALAHDQKYADLFGIIEALDAEGDGHANRGMVINQITDLLYGRKQPERRTPVPYDCNKETLHKMLPGFPVDRLSYFFEKLENDDDGSANEFEDDKDDLIASTETIFQLAADPGLPLEDTPSPVVTVESPDEPLHDESDPADTDEFDSTTVVGAR
ncbi:MAG: hypothetical protein MZW92_02840 [Comamonadaceae bacterium]|nr:hypothetical protein [Comamonadaceae bacterium]